jgi:hypothetical protein
MAEKCQESATVIDSLAWDLNRQIILEVRDSIVPATVNTNSLNIPGLDSKLFNFLNFLGNKLFSFGAAHTPNVAYAASASINEQQKSEIRSLARKGGLMINEIHINTPKNM